MEIYNGTPTTVTVAVPPGYVDPTVELLDADGNRISYNNPSSTTSTTVSFAVPYRATKTDTTLKALVNFAVDGFHEVISTDIDVVTPILPLTDVKSILNSDPTQVTDARAQDLERRVRIAIQVYTNEVFAPYTGTITVYGNNDRGLRLPRRLLSIDHVDFNGHTATVLTDYHYLIKADGKYLEAPTPLFWDIKDCPPDYVLQEFTYYQGTGVIASPPLYRHYQGFSSNVAYDITGTWGWPTVPYDVQQAARYLVNDYGCDESLYRDRYIDNMRAADWRFQFRADAFEGTGNVQADQILSQYRPSGMQVI